MSAPASGLVRNRGGRSKTVSRLKAALRNSLSRSHSNTACARPSDAGQRTEESLWKAKLARAVELANKGNLRRAVHTLVRTGIAPPTRENIEKLRAKHRTQSSAIPPCPDDAPKVIVDEEVLGKLIKKSCDGLRGGASGWTSKLILALWPDQACRRGLILLIQSILTNEVDMHSRFLLTCSLLHGIGKRETDDLRPLAIGEEFLRLAAKYCFQLDSASFPEIFEPIQLAIGSASGSERAMQKIQAAIEYGLNDGHIAIHVDSINAYNEADRGSMLREIYSDPNLANTWRTYALIYERPSLLLVVDRGTVLEPVQSECR